MKTTPQQTSPSQQNTAVRTIRRPTRRALNAGKAVPRNTAGGMRGGLVGRVAPLANEGSDEARKLANAADGATARSAVQRHRVVTRVRVHAQHRCARLGLASGERRAL